MLIEQLPTMAKAFRTTLSGDGRYEMTFRFQSMEDMHAADDEWRSLAKAQDILALPALAVVGGQETIRDALLDSQYLAGAKAGWTPLAYAVRDLLREKG